MGTTVQMAAARYERNQNDEPNNVDDNHDDNDQDDDKMDQEFSLILKNMNKCENLLKSVRIFHHLDSQKAREIARNMQLKKYKDGDIILREGEKASGTAVVHYQATNDRPTIPLSTLHRSDYFGGKCLLFHKPSTVSVKTSGSLKCFKANRLQFRKYVKPVLVNLKQRAQQYQSFEKLYL